MIQAKRPVGLLFVFAAIFVAARVSATPASLVAAGDAATPSAVSSFTPPAPGYRPSFEPPPPGVDPLSLATSHPSCDADAQAAATPILAQLRADVAAYQAKAPLPKSDLLDVFPHAVSADPSVPYYFELHPGGGGDAAPSGAVGGMSHAPAPQAARGGPQSRAMRGMLACTYVTVLSASDAQAKGIVTQGRPGLFYVPGVGIVAVRRQMPQGGS
jgi:hypothetical protein